MAMPRILFLIPARAGSKRVPAKNLRTVAGISLVGGGVRRARRAAVLLGASEARVVCSTDDDSVAAEARAWGAEVPFLRPAAISGDEATAVEVALHALDWYERRGEEFDLLALVQPTSPTLLPEDIVATVESLMKVEASSAATIGPASPVEWLYSLADGRLEPRIAPRMGRRQDLTPTYALTGGVFVVRPKALRASECFVTPGSTVGVVLPPERSLDVDEAADLELAEALARHLTVTPVVIGPHEIGSGRCFIVAEAGVNHNGSLDLARQLVEAAARAGADAVKFQTFEPDELAAAGAPLAEYQARAVEDISQRAMLERLALSHEAQRDLRDRASAAGIIFLSSAFDESSAAFLFDLGVPAFKLGSGELTNHALLRRVAAYGRPMLVSTGMGTMREVAAAVDVLSGVGGMPPVPLVLLHCVSSYPADEDDSNLAAIDTMRAAFRVPIGWSDHMSGIDIAVAAAARGAAVVEKHLTMSRELRGPDHQASIEPDEFGVMVSTIRAVERARGSGEKRPTRGEIAMATVARKSLHWAQPLPEGTVVDAAHLRALRPGTGFSPGNIDLVVGRSLRRAVQSGSLVEMADLAGEGRAARNG